MKKPVVTVLLICCFLLSPQFLSAEKPKYEIKFASVAPDGSTWMKIMRALDKEIREKTEGLVGFKIYPGGVQGDEIDVIRKIRYGQLHSAGFTGAGLGEILPEIRVLELPFLFNSKDEVDHITDTFYDRFDSSFREQGYVLLGFTEVGYVYIFSKKPVSRTDDLKGMKVWSWEGDPLAKSLFENIGVKPLPLSLPEVLTGLQTGMLDAVYCSPLAAISLQWFSRVNYMSLQPITNSTGAVLVSKKKFDAIPEETQNVVLEICRERLRELTELSRIDNQASIKEMEKAGIELTQLFSDEDMAKSRKLGEDIQQQLSGELYSEELLGKIKNELTEFRNKK